jgi:hypothetical protein
MKRLFLIVILSMAVAASVGQTKKGFAKISPGVMIPDKGNESFAAFISGGPTIGRYVAAGPSFGYFKANDETVVAAGAEIIFTDFRTRKVFPYVAAAFYYPFYDKKSTYANVGIVSSTSVKGMTLIKPGLGVSIPMPENKRLMISAYYAPAKFKTENKTQYTGAQPHTVITTGTSTIKQYFISIEFML